MTTCVSTINRQGQKLDISNTKKHQILKFMIIETIITVLYTISKTSIALGLNFELKSSICYHPQS